MLNLPGDVLSGVVKLIWERSFLGTFFQKSDHNLMLNLSGDILSKVRLII